ncbi:MAG: PD-(D/E)XK nuclease family protein [Clostridia bacterium]|nr:PD-(D/E)XK nuclease family protein [Clostridia bacterium]
MITFVFGHSGCGKSAYIEECIREDVKAGKKAILIVPEQEVYTAEHRLLSSLPKNAGLHFEILSFSRLAQKVFGMYGGIATEPVTSAARSLYMWKTLRELSGMLEQYRNTSDPALPALMLGVAEELRAAGMTPADAERACAKMGADSPLYKKMRDISLVWACFENALDDGFGGDPADQLTHLSSVLERHGEFFSDTRVYIDSFTSFTYPEYRVLRQMLACADDVTLTLCLSDPAVIPPHMEEQGNTLRRLLRICDELGLAHDTLTLTHSIRTSDPALIALEQKLWSFSADPEPQSGKEMPISLHVCATPYAEADAAALHIVELMSRGYAPGDIAVVVRDVEAWRGILDRAMEQYHVPYFLSRRSDISAYPAARLIQSALRCVSTGYRRADVMTLLHTGLCGVESADADRFEEYCETWNISGNRFFSEVWTMNPDGYSEVMSPRATDILAAANRTKDAVMLPLQTLEMRLRAAEHMPDMCAALWEYLNTLRLSDRLADLAATQLSLDRIREAGDTVRLYDHITQVLAELAALMPDEVLTPAEFAQALGVMLAKSDIGSVPSMQDCVMIGSAATMRIDHVRVSLLHGLNEGEFPASVSDSGLLSEQDKIILGDLGFGMHKTKELRSSAELFYVYRAMTKPGERLILSRSEKNASGKDITPGVAWQRVLHLFPDCKETSVHLPHAIPQKADADLATLPCLTPAAARALLGDKLYLSKSKIQVFASCPYRFFSENILELRKRAPATVSYADAGSFIHYVLEHFIKACMDEEGHVQALEKEAAERLADSIISLYISAVCHSSLEAVPPSLMHRFSKLRRLALSLLEVLMSDLSQGLFIPAAFEQRISEHDPTLPSPMVLPVGNSPLPAVCIGGTVDRVDLWRHEGKTYLRIVDYKTGSSKFKLEDAYSGKDIQLPLYLFTICSPENAGLYDKDGAVVPAAALYFSAAEENGQPKPFQSGMILSEDGVPAAIGPNADPEKKKAGTLYCSADELAEINRNIQSTVRDIATQMYDGIIEKRPDSDACRFCRIKDSCDRAVVSEF